MGQMHLKRAHLWEVHRMIAVYWCYHPLERVVLVLPTRYLRRSVVLCWPLYSI